MQPADAAFVIDYLQASFPGTLRDEEHVVVWIEELARYERVRAIATIRRLRESQKWLPSHSEFRSTYQAIVADEQRRSALERGLRADTGEAVGPKGALGWVEQIRSTAGLQRRHDPARPQAE